MTLTANCCLSDLMYLGHLACYLFLKTSRERMRHSQQHVINDFITSLMSLV